MGNAPNGYEIKKHLYNLKKYVKVCLFLILDIIIRKPNLYVFRMEVMLRPEDFISLTSSVWRGTTMSE